MELEIEVDEKKVFTAQYSTFLNNCKLTDSVNIDVILPKAQFTNISDLLKHGQIIRVIGDIKPTAKGDKFYATSARVGDVMYTRTAEAKAAAIRHGFDEPAELAEIGRTIVSKSGKTAYYDDNDELLEVPAF